MLFEIQGRAFNPQQVVSMVKDTKYNNMGNATLYRLRVKTEHEGFEFIYPNDTQSRDEDFDKIIDAANGKQDERSEQMEGYTIGEYIIYRNGEKYELGRIKSLREDGAFVAYHEGETGAKTPYHCMHKLINSYAIKETSLGGDYFKADTPHTDCGWK